MNKTELVEAIAKDTGLTKKDSEAALAAFRFSYSRHTTDIINQQSRAQDPLIVDYPITKARRTPA